MKRDTTTTDSAPTEIRADPAAVFRANLNAVNMMQQKILCARAQAVDDPAEVARLLLFSQGLTNSINEFMG